MLSGCHCRRAGPLPLAVPSSAFGGRRRLVLADRCAKKSSLHPPLAAVGFFAHELRSPVSHPKAVAQTLPSGNKKQLFEVDGCFLLAWCSKKDIYFFSGFFRLFGKLLLLRSRRHIVYSVLHVRMVHLDQVILPLTKRAIFKMLNLCPSVYQPKIHLGLYYFLHIWHLF